MAKKGSENSTEKDVKAKSRTAKTKAAEAGKAVAEKVTKAAEDIQVKVADKASDAKEEIKKGQEKVKKTVAKVEEAAAKVEETVAPAKAKAKSGIKNAASRAKKALKGNEMIVQYAGRSFTVEDLEKKAKEVWKKEMKKKIMDFVNVTFYVKTEENMVYFVVGGQNGIKGQFSIEGDFFE